MENAAGQGSAGREISAAKMDWLYELELADVLKRPAKKNCSAKEAVDGLFTRDPLW